MPDLTVLFEQLVRFQIELWNGVDARLRTELGSTLSGLESMRVIDARGVCRVNDIAEDLVITIGGASKIVDRLEAAGLCARRSNPDDRRSSLIELTDVGRVSLAAANHTLTAELERRFDRLPSDTLSKLIETLTTLRTAGAELTTS